MGLAYLNEEPLASQFAERLLASGKPVFYISKLSRGVSQGDIIRFKDKAVLIDGDVWQTMQSMGILKRLTNIPVMALTARSKSDVWASRSDQVSRSSENKGYTLGRELLKIFEDYFGRTPSRSEMVISFSGSHMTLTAPRQLLDELNFVNVVRVHKNKDNPAFITEKPPSPTFTGQPFSWTVWAIDPLEPSGQLQYSFTSELPPGLSWDAPSHSLSGTPDQAGSFTLSFSSRNARGQQVALLCTLLVKENTAPRVQAKIDELVLSGTHLTIEPFVSDAEHASSELTVKLFNQPEGMAINESNRLIEWAVPHAAKDTTYTFVLAARDPLGAVGRGEFSIEVLSKANAHKAVSIDFRLPVDTLIQGHTYRWPDRTWKQAMWHERNVRLESVTGTNITRYDSTGTGELFVKPINTGNHSITFTFIMDTLSFQVTKTCPVIPSKPPVFKSRLTADTYQFGQKAFYTPVVVDDDGDQVTLKLIDQYGGERIITEDAVELITDKTGFHTLLFKASDPYGNIAYQQIYYSVPQREKKVVSEWFIQKGNRSTFDVAFQAPGFRVGLHSANIVRTLESGFLGLNTFQSPFLFIGGNPLGEKQFADGNYLFADCGISARMHDAKLFSGGVVGRIETNYRKGGISPWRFQGVLSLRLKQALFVTDTAGLGEELGGYVDEYLQSGEINLPPIVEKLGEIFGSYGETDNVGFYLKLQTLYNLPWGFWLGPSIWMEDDIRMPDSNTVFENESSRLTAYGNVLLQYTGLCLLHDYRIGRVALSQQLNIGWRGNSGVPRAEWIGVLRFISR